MRSEQSPVLIFLHIPKTAGTTFNILLEHHYQASESFSTFATRMHPDGSLEGFKKLSQEKIGRLKLVMGHMGFGLHERFLRPVTYVTLLREPVKRVLSQYLHEMRDPTSATHDIIQAGHMDLKEFGRYYAASKMDNLQTRMISGNWERRGHGPCDEEMLEQAKRNLRHHFSVVGLSREFDVFYLLVCRQMGFRPHYYVRHNQAPKVQTEVVLDEETRKKIEGYNQFDMALYEYGRSLSAELVAAQGKNFSHKLSQYRLINWMYQQYWSARKVSVRSWMRERVLVV